MREFYGFWMDYWFAHPVLFLALLVAAFAVGWYRWPK
jgi:hypothetical protein